MDQGTGRKQRHQLRGLRSDPDSGLAKVVLAPEVPDPAPVRPFLLPLPSFPPSPLFSSFSSSFFLESPLNGADGMPVLVVPNEQLRNLRNLRPLSRISVFSFRKWGKMGITMPTTHGCLRITCDDGCEVLSKQQMLHPSRLPPDSSRLRVLKPASDWGSEALSPWPPVGGNSRSFSEPSRVEVPWGTWHRQPFALGKGMLRNGCGAF